MSTNPVRDGFFGLSGGDPLFGNKIAAGILVPLLFAVALNVGSSIIYTPHKPAIPGYDLPQPEPVAEGGGEQAQAEPLPVRLASADATKGQGAAKKCLACHVFEKGGPNKIGPNLFGVVGHQKGAHEGFAYSAAMKGKGGTWTYDDLDHFLTNPKGYVPGTIMAFAGVSSPKERADILAYLKGLSDSPVPFPEPAADTGGDKAAAPGAAPAQQPSPPAQRTDPGPAAQPAQPTPASPQTQPTTPNQPQPPASGAAPGTPPTAAGQPATPPAQAPASQQPAPPPGTAGPSSPGHQ